MNFLGIFFIFTNVFILLDGKTFRHPITCQEQPNSPSCYEPDPIPTPWPIIDEVGELVYGLDANGVQVVPPQQPPPPPPGEDDPLLDIVAKGVRIPKEEEGLFHIRTEKLERYFPEADIGGIKDSYEGTGLEVVEWPGAKSDVPPPAAPGVPTQPADHPDKTYQGRLESRFGGRKFAPLLYVGDKSVFDTYVCNRRLGTHIQVMALQTLAPANFGLQFPVRIYLAFGSRSFHREYTAPLYAPLDQFNKLSEGFDENHDCHEVQPEDFDPDTSYINLVYSMAFSSNRLLLGMHCGILILKPLDSNQNYIEAARRIPEPHESEEWAKYGSTETFIHEATAKTKLTKPRFPTPITRISSNICCAGICQDMEPIAVAYYYSINDAIADLRIKVVYVSTDHGESWDQKVVSTDGGTFIKLVANMYKNSALDIPESISRRIVELKSNRAERAGPDIAVDYIMSGGNVPNNTIEYGTGMCDQIVSVQASPEEKGFLALCLLQGQFNHPQGGSFFLNYAVFEFSVSKFSPIIHAIRRTTRAIACNFPHFDELAREPEIVLGRKSMNLIIRGCGNALYHSINGGVTFSNAVFYTQALDGTYQRTYQLPGFSYPIVAMDPNGVSMTFAFGDFYAVGIISYTKEFRVIVGRITETKGKTNFEGLCDNSNQNPCTACKNTALEPPGCTTVKLDCLRLPQALPGSPIALECQDYYDSEVRFGTRQRFLTYYTNSGAIKFSTSLMHFLNLPGPIGNTYQPLYRHRLSIRLIDIPFSFTDAMRPFFTENEFVKDKTKGYAKCETFAFKVNETEQSLDLGQTGKFTVSVDDKRVELELGVFASLANMLQIDVQRRETLGDGSLNDHHTHIWDVAVKPFGVLKDKLTLLEDSFFGSNYDLFSYKSSNLIVTNPPVRRCHTQPTGSVLLHLGCSGKKLAAHEDYNRPQCAKFFGINDPDNPIVEPYKFTLDDGRYDPELVAYWKNRNKELFKREGNSWVVEYDYATFGCPIQPFRLENFEPDLRVMDREIHANMSDTMAGLPFAGEYVLIEIFGQTGFHYLKTVKESGCKRPPLTLKRMLKEWKERRKVLFDAFDIYKSFHPLEVAKPENIWQKSMHQGCFDPELKPAEDADELKFPENDPYEIMERGSGNAIVWDRKTRKDLYFFLAIDVDQESETFCDYTTFFAVSLSSEPRSPTFHSFLRFILVLAFILLLIVLGYYFFRYYVNKSFRETSFYARMERGAWEILLRYERYLHEVQVQENEKIEMVDNKPTLVIPKEKKRQTSYEKVKSRKHE